MSETTRRVNVTLTFATDDEAADIAYSVMAVVRDESRFAHDLEAISLHAFDPPMPETSPETRPVALHVITPDGEMTTATRRLSPPAAADLAARAMQVAPGPASVVLVIPQPQDEPRVIVRASASTLAAAALLASMGGAL